LCCVDDNVLLLIILFASGSVSHLLAGESSHGNQADSSRESVTSFINLIVERRILAAFLAGNKHAAGGEGE
jgi:hypothetical protein